MAAQPHNHYDTASRTSSQGTVVAQVHSKEVDEKGNGQASPSTDGAKPQISFRQWMIIVSSFMVFLNSWGFLLSFGALQTYYQDEPLKDKSSSDIAWISTVCAFISIGLGLVTGPLYDRGYNKHMYVAGSLLEIFGIMMISISSKYYQFFLSQGICIGIGMSLLYVPASAAISANFTGKLRPKVLGVVASGTGLGGLIYPIIFQQLLPQIGFAWTVRTIGFFILALQLLGCIAVWFEPTKDLTVRPWFDARALREPPFVLAILGGFFYGMAYYLPLLYVPAFATDTVLPPSQASFGVYLVAIINGVSAVGRIGAGLIAARVGPIETIAVSLAIAAVVLFCWTAVSSLTGIIVWAVFWGLTSSVIVAVLSAVIPILTPDLRIVGTRSGMYFVCVGLGLLLGGPIGGAEIGAEAKGDTQWWRVEVTAALFMVVACLCFLVPMAHVRRTGRSTA